MSCWLTCDTVLVSQGLDRQPIHEELERVRADLRQLVEQATPADLRRRTDGTQWTNGQMLWHMVFGYLIVWRLLPGVRLFGRLPDGFSRRFAGALNAGTRPFQQVPFQFSDHVILPGGSLEHHSFLHQDERDPRRPLVEALLKTLGREGPIVVYSGFEARIVRTLAEEVPERAEELLAVVDRMVDLLELIRSHYYHPRFDGSFSIKNVLPALIEDLDYDDLVIREGSQAATAFIEMIDQETPEPKRGELRGALYAYCERDTEAMVRLYQKLREGG